MMSNETTVDIETKILGLSGKKQSGKNTAANYIMGLNMKALGITQDFTINKKGLIEVTDIMGDKESAGIFDPNLQTPEMGAFLDQYIHPYVKIYSYADILKRGVCMSVLGLTYKQCYGTNKEKDSPTHLRWGNMPGVITSSKCEQVVAMLGIDYNSSLDEIRDAITGDEDLNLITRDGPMTAREVMQYVGTDIFRRMYGDVWVNALLRKIKQENPLVAVICDTRFPNEVQGVKAAGGRTVRFTRDPFKGEDQHESETALDPDKFDWAKFDGVIETDTIEGQGESLYTILRSWEYVPEVK
jgi:hypothetical protein